MNPLPPSFPVELSKGIIQGSPAYEYVKGIVKPIFDKVAKETKLNHMMVGKGGQKSKNYALYNPHNYRLYIDFNRFGFKQDITKPPFKGWLRGVILNKTEILYKSNDFNLRIKKNQIEIQNKKNTWSKVHIGSRSEKEILKIITRKDKECLFIIKKFIKKYGGSSNLKILKRTSENKIEHEDIINSLDPKLIFHNKVVKKVYNENNVEFLDPAYAVNHLVNSAIYKLTPEIASAIHTINPLRAIKQNTKNINDIFKFKNYIDLLSIQEKEDLSLWLYSKFGVYYG